MELYKDSRNRKRVAYLCVSPMEHLCCDQSERLCSTVTIECKHRVHLLLTNNMLSAYQLISLYFFLQNVTLSISGGPEGGQGHEGSKLLQKVFVQIMKYHNAIVNGVVIFAFYLSMTSSVKKGRTERRPVLLCGFSIWVNIFYVHGFLSLTGTSPVCPVYLLRSSHH